MLPTRLRRTPVALAVTLALAGGVTACGGSDEQAAAPAAPTPATSAPPSPAQASEPSPEPSEPSEPSGAAGEYVDPSGFAITFPDGWERIEDLPGAAVGAFLPDSAQSDPMFRDNVNVVLEKTSQPDLTVEQYTQAGAAGISRSIQDAKIIAQDPAAGTIEYTGKTPATADRPLHFLARIVVNDGTAYVATFTAPEEGFAQARPVAEPVLATLRAG